MRQSNNPFIKRIEYIMFHEKEIRDAVLAVREDPRHVFVGNSRKKPHSDPTADKALNDIEEIKTVEIASGGTVAYPERWLSIIDLAHARLNSSHKAIMLARYQYHERYIKTIRRIHISQATYSRYLEQVRQWLTIAAVQKGLIKII